MSLPLRARWLVASALPLLAAALPAQTVAPTAPDATSDAASRPTNGGGEEIVVTGTRTVGRSRLDTASPVDVLSGASLRQQGTTQLGAALAAIAPSIDFPRAAAVDGTDAIRPATLRGLSPDQTLVLINGVRAHASALLNINGSVGRGAAAVDLNTVPVVALDTIEVLRDGASAQYGSDAIAGVVNLRLRQARSGGGASVTYGLYDTDIRTARGRRSTTGEDSVTASAWQGFGFGDDGYVTLSGEFVDSRPTSRGDFDPRVSPTRVDSRFGDPSINQKTGWINAGTSIDDHWQLYGWAGYQYRDSSSAAFPRLATTAAASGVGRLYPNGFLPLINTRSRDLNATVGLKGTLGEWAVDANVSYGRNSIAFRTERSANYTYGNASPTSFYDGRLVYDQLVGGVDVSRRFDVFHGLNVAFGAEGRREGYRIDEGEPTSYGYGTANTRLAPGAQGFLGFAPANAIDRHRENGSAYLDLEADLTEKLLVGLAGRGEYYSDFGWTGTGKVSARYQLAPWLALRGTASTGFRAPSLQQQYFTSVSSVVTNGVPILTGTYPSVSPVAGALGGLALKPEKSTNLSAGTVIRFGGFDLTVDGYRIHVRDGVGLSENIAATASPQVAALLAPYNVAAARFFINGIASTTEGVDAVAHYRLRAGDIGQFDLTLVGNVNRIRVTRVPTSTAVLDPAPTLFARSRILTIQEGTPGEKVTGTVDWSRSVLGATARVSYYGDVLQPGTTAAADYDTGRRAIVDLEARYQPKKGVQLALGAQNLLDTYPRRVPAALNSTGVLGFPYYSPYGFNGRFLYVRAGVNW